MPDFNIQIDTQATGDGAQKSAAELQKVKDAAQQAASPMKELTQETDKAEVSKGKLAIAVQKLTHVFPGFGVVVSAIKSPFILAAAAVANLVAQFRSLTAEENALAASMRVHEHLSKSMFSLGGAAADAAGHLERFNIALADAAQRSQTTVDQLARVQEAIKQLDVQETEKRSAQEALEIARINAAEKTGALSPEQAIRQRAGVKDRFAKERQAAQEALEVEMLESRKETLRKTMEQRVADEAALPEAVRAAAEAGRIAKAGPAKDKSDLEAIATERTGIAAQIESIEKSRGGFQMMGLEALAAIAPAGSAAAQAPAGFRKVLDDQLDALNKRKDALDRQEAIIAKRAEDRDRTAKQKADAAALLEKAVQTGRATEGQLFGEIIAGDQGLERGRFHRRQIGGIEAATRAIDTDANLAVAAVRAQAETNAAIAAALREILPGVKLLKAEADDFRRQFKNIQGQ